MNPSLLDQLCELFLDPGEGGFLLDPKTNAVAFCSSLLATQLVGNKSNITGVKFEDFCTPLNPSIQSLNIINLPENKGISFNAVIQGHDKSERTVAITAKKIVIRQKTFISVVVRELQLLGVDHDYTSFLQNLSLEVSSIRSIKELISTLFEAIQEFMPGTACCIGLPSQDDTSLPMSWYGNPKARVLEVCQLCHKMSLFREGASHIEKVDSFSPAISHILKSKKIEFVASYNLMIEDSLDACFWLFLPDQSWSEVQLDTLENLVLIIRKSLSRILSDSMIEQHNIQLQDLAYHDHLTHLPNRTLLNDRLSQACAHARREKKLLAICYLDLDGFKGVNDKFGHDFGDNLLIAVAETLSDCIRENDTVCRVGGDEFVLLLNNIQSRAEVIKSIKRINKRITKAIDQQRNHLNVTSSIGITLYPVDDSAPHVLIRHADQAMYQAKENGKNGYEFFQSHVNEDLDTEDVSLISIKEAMLQNRLLLYFQPQVSLRSGKFVGVEVLLRLKTPNGKIHLPGEFLPFIDDYDFLKVLDEWVIQQTLTQVEKWANSGIEVPVSVNINGLQLQNPEFAYRLETFLWEHPSVPVGFLNLEILETSALENITRSSATIKACQALGVNFSIDDFGTGYSSLTYLKKLNSTSLKLDYSFVKGVLDDPEDFAIIEGIIALAKTFNRKVIAEGVESEEQGELLIQAGCDIAQGFYIGMPMPADELVSWLQHYRHSSKWLELATDYKDSNFDHEVLRLEVLHRQWLKGVMIAAEERLPVHNIPPTSCQLGYWLNSDSSSRFRANESFVYVKERHEEVHSKAAKFLALRIEQRDEEASSTHKELMQAHKALVVNLMNLSRVSD